MQHLASKFWKSDLPEVNFDLELDATGCVLYWANYVITGTDRLCPESFIIFFLVLKVNWKK